MSFKVYYSNPSITTEAGFGLVAAIPCIFDSRPGYHRRGSQYLIDRGLGLWNPKTGFKVPRVPPTDQSIRDYADWLINFLEWAEVRRVNLDTCSYVADVYGTYQKEMLEGKWSVGGAKLSVTTVNLRVRTACEYLTWLSHKGFRKEFVIPVVDSLSNNFFSASKEKGNADRGARQGAVRGGKRHLRMPTDEQIWDWLEDVETKFGNAKGLMCETVLLAALRRSEIAAFRVDTLPEDPRDWHINDLLAEPKDQRVLINLKYGAKGPKYGLENGDKIGPERSVWIPLSHAQRLHEYRNKHRNIALDKWVRSAKSIAEKKRRIKETVHLFLNDDTGEPIRGAELYRAWTGAAVPYKGWTIHLGRDWWACSTLLHHMKKHEHLLSLGRETASVLLETTAIGIIRMHIMPFLGHAHESTSMIYLQWIADMLGFNLNTRRGASSAVSTENGFKRAPATL